MSAFSIHPQPAKVIERAAAVLETLIDLDEVSLGGGTALEAHWHHRTSTDLDFFATGARIDTLFYEFEQLNDVMTAHWKAGRIDGKRPSVTRRTVLHFEIDSTPVSIGRVSEIHGSGEDTEILTGIKLSHNKDILTKKLFNRLFENQVVTERDAYDFGVARTFDAQSLEYAWSHIGKHARQGVIGSLEALASRTVKLDEAKRVQNAEYPGFLSNVWKEVLAMFVSDLQYQPHLSADPDS